MVDDVVSSVVTTATATMSSRSLLWTTNGRGPVVLTSNSPVLQRETMFSYTATDNGMVIDGDAWILITSSPSTTYSATSREAGNNTSTSQTSLDQQTSQSSAGRFAMTTSGVSELCKSVVIPGVSGGVDCTTGQPQELLPSDFTPWSTSIAGITKLSNALSVGESNLLHSIEHYSCVINAATTGTTPPGALVTTTAQADAISVDSRWKSNAMGTASNLNAQTAQPPFALTINIPDIFTLPETELATGIPILLKVDESGYTTRRPVHPSWAPSSNISQPIGNISSGLPSAGSSRSGYSSSPPLPTSFSGHACTFRLLSLFQVCVLIFTVCSIVPFM